MKSTKVNAMKDPQDIQEFNTWDEALAYSDTIDKEKNRVLAGRSENGKTFTVEIQPY